MKVALTGATGFVGRAVAERLLLGGHQLRGSGRSRFNSCFHEDDYEVVRGDLRSPAVRKALVEGADALIHCAASLGTSDRLGMYEMNAYVSRELAQLARANDVKRFVLLSSTGVYGQPGGTIDETSPHRPFSSYERSKSQAEAAVTKVLVPGSLTIVRPSNIVAESHDGRPLLRFLRRVRSRSVFGSRAAQTNYVHLDDVADVIVRSLMPGAPDAVIVNDAVPLCLFVPLARRALEVDPRHDKLVSAFTGQCLAAALEGHRHRHTAVSRALALFDDSRFLSRHRQWARGTTLPHEAAAKALERLVRGYRAASLL